MPDDDAEEVLAPLIECLEANDSFDTPERKTKRYRAISALVRMHRDVTKLKDLHTDRDTGEMMNVPQLWSEHKKLWERYKMVCLAIYALSATMVTLGATMLWLLQILSGLKGLTQ